MVNKKTLNRLAIFTLLVAIPVSIIFMHSGGSAIKHKNEPLYPGLGQSLEQVVQIQIKNQNDHITLVRAENTWGLAERGNYPVDPDQVKSLLQGVAELKIVEPKTSNALLYEQLDLADLTQPGSKAWQLVMLNDKQEEVINLIIGKREAVQNGEQYAERIFARKSGDNQSWLVQGLLPLNLNLRDWIEQPLVEFINENQIKSVVVTKPDNTSFTISKNAVEQQDFELQNPPVQAGMKLDVDAVNTVPFEVAELEFDDIVPATEKQLDWSHALSAKVETFPGMALDLAVIRDGEQVYAKVLAKVPENANPELQEQATKLNALTQAWYYKLAPEFYNTIDLANSDFLQEEIAVPSTEVN
jgi:hypothetical protein